MRHRLSFLLLVMFVVAAGCGQKPSVEKRSALVAARGGSLGAGGGSFDESAALPGDDTGAAAAAQPGAAAGGGAASTGGTTAGTVARPGAKTGAAAGPAAGAAAGAKAAGKQDTTGISDKEIKIGLHAPITGAAPIPQRTFEAGVNVYWEFVRKQGGILGGKVGKLLYRDDTFDPSRAVQVCREMVEQEQVFVLMGGGGADQVTACAKYANGKGVPYLSAGVNEAGISTLAGYFAISMSYTQQSPLLAQLVKNVLGKTKVGVVVTQTGSFDDAFASIQQAVKSAGMTVTRAQRISKNAGDAGNPEGPSEVLAQQNAGSEVIYVLASPTTFINIAKGTPETYKPVFIGPGLSSGLNSVAELGCPSIAGARFLSPFPQTDVVETLDADFGREYRAQNGGNAPDDFAIALWGLNKTLRFMFEATGSALSRQSLVAALESGKDIATNVYPAVKYGPGKHLGATTAHLLRADCSGRGVWKTEKQFASGF